jgi:hypothetical protein
MHVAQIKLRHNTMRLGKRSLNSRLRTTFMTSTFAHACVPTYMCASKSAKWASLELIKAGPTMVLRVFHMCAAAYCVRQKVSHRASIKSTKSVNHHPFKLSCKNQNPLTSCPYFRDAPQMSQYLHKEIEHRADSQTNNRARCRQLAKFESQSSTGTRWIPKVDHPTAHSNK